MGTVEEDMEARRYVRGRCSECQAPSPVIDQKLDPHRELVGQWFHAHKQAMHPGPWVKWEIAEPVVSVDTVDTHKTPLTSSVERMQIWTGAAGALPRSSSPTTAIWLSTALGKREARTSELLYW